MRKSPILFFAAARQQVPEIACHTLVRKSHTISGNFPANGTLRQALHVLLRHGITGKFVG